MDKVIKYFTPDEARKTLPLVGKIVEDILREGREIKLLAIDITGEIKDNPEIQAKVEVMQGYMDELTEIGCYFKDWDFSIGLIDFPSVIDGEDVFLCWRSDEKDITFYHDIESGYAGRKLIPESYFS